MNAIAAIFEKAGERLTARQRWRVAGAAGQTYQQRVLALNPIAYWPLNEPAGTSGAGSVLDATENGRTGTPTGVTFGATGAGDGGTSVSLSGSNSFIDVFSASLSAAFNKDEFTFMAWVRPSGIGVWTDSTNRHVCLFGVSADFLNYFRVYKTNAANAFLGGYIGGGVVKSIPLTSQSWITWRHVALVVSKAGDYMRLLLDGVQQGADVTGLPTWTGALSSGFCSLGARDNSGVLGWSGNMAHAALFATPLPTAQIQTVSSF